jgi:hypothetical protein
MSAILERIREQCAEHDRTYGSPAEQRELVLAGWWLAPRQMEFR